MGNGRYSADLTYDQWFIFNNFQRCHYNYLEQLTPVLVMIILSSYYKPLAAAILALVYFVGRVFYTFGYIKSANKRLIGAILIDLGFLGIFILSLVAIGSWSA